MAASTLARSRAALPGHRLPDAIAYASHPVPLDRCGVAERLEREFYLSLGSSAQVILWLKRIMTSTLPASTYQIRVPEGQRAMFEAALPGLSTAGPAHSGPISGRAQILRRLARGRRLTRRRLRGSRRRSRRPRSASARS